MPEHNRLAGNCVHQSARATDDQVCRVPDCLDANPIEPSGIPDKLPATSDVVQRARQALDGITKGEWSLYEDAWRSDVPVHRVGSLSDNRDIALTPHRDDDDTANARFIAAAPDLVRDLLALVEVALPTITAQRDDALSERDRLRSEVEKLRAAVDRVRKLADDREQNGMPAFEVPSLLAAAQLRRALDREAQ